MVKQYPHVLNIILPSGDATLDSQGNWVIPDPADPILIPCRYERNLASKIIRTSDGTEIQCSGIIYMPTGYPDVVFGAKLKVFDNGILILSDIAKDFSKGQLNARLWV